MCNEEAIATHLFLEPDPAVGQHLRECADCLGTAAMMRLYADVDDIESDGDELDRLILRWIRGDHHESHPSAATIAAAVIDGAVPASTGCRYCEAVAAYAVELIR